MFSFWLIVYYVGRHNVEVIEHFMEGIFRMGQYLLREKDIEINQIEYSQPVINE